MTTDCSCQASAQNFNVWLRLWSQYVMELSLAFHFSHPIPISEEKWLDFKIIGQKRFTECVIHMLFII
jgi:hypothetical protein